jgi:hypothetical protein
MYVVLHSISQHLYTVATCCGTRRDGQAPEHDSTHDSTHCWTGIANVVSCIFLIVCPCQGKSTRLSLAILEDEFV